MIIWTPEIEADIRQWYYVEQDSLAATAAKIKTKYGVKPSAGAVAARVNHLGLQRRAHRPKAATKRPTVSTVTNVPIRRDLEPPYVAKDVPTGRPPLSKTLMQLNTGECHWPVTATGPFFFCGHRVQSGKKYCSEHQAAAHDGGPRSAKDLIRSIGSLR